MEGTGNEALSGGRRLVLFPGILRERARLVVMTPEYREPLPPGQTSGGCALYRLRHVSGHEAVARRVGVE